ncbi:ATP-dependent DNA helicase PIF1-like [Anastrepha ludens]|uniref:ATP-dependent DNA helicase PIF1-like n=1 Tax=Anastrepha ludens TaxID=28586 RepID=UPI0023B1AD8E|nr:ATP-dependent DNA helicase PIF1-like [Anastrepha ludens]
MGFFILHITGRIYGRIPKIVCQHLGLLENDNHWEITLSEAGLSCLPSQLRSLLAIILTTCSPSDPKALWENHKDDLSEDYMRAARAANDNTNLNCSLQIYNQALIDIENICISVNSKSLEHLGLHSPVRDRIDLADKDISRKMNYDIEALHTFISKSKPLLVTDQTVAYETIQGMIIDNKGGLIFLDAPGGTGKTFLLNLILADVREKKEIAVAVASSGIAATLLCGGRTAHSVFKLPLSMQISGTPMCNISKNSGQGRVLKTCKLIVWDECTMAHKKSLEALDRSLRDLRGNDQPMGGALLLLAGDFRQILPVIPKGTAADEVNACLKSSYLWD